MLGRGSAFGRWLPAASLLVLLASCSPCPKGESSPGTHPGPSSHASATALPTPTDYAHVCDIEGSVCSCPNGTSSSPRCAESLPAALLRQVRRATLAPGQKCPTTTAPHPVYPSMHQGALEVWPEGWYGAKTMWIVDPSYSGPVLVRGFQLDGSGRIAFGESPLIGQLIIPPGDTVNELPGGYRTAPGGTFVKGPGCYGLQVDGLTFSYVIVFQVQITLQGALEPKPTSQ
jgi:hypothetical protein